MYPSELEGEAKALYGAFDDYTTNRYGVMYTTPHPPSDWGHITLY